MEANNAFYTQPKPNIRARSGGESSRVGIRVMVLEKCNSRWKPHFQGCAFCMTQLPASGADILYKADLGRRHT